MRVRMLTALLLLSAALAAGAAEPKRNNGPWDVKALQGRVPQHQLADTQRVKEGEVPVSISSLYYEGEPLMGKPTRIFAYYARPAEPEEKKLPAMVLVHGGGGTAFPQWARLWAARGYAALAMDLSGSGPERMRLPDGMPDQSDESKFLRLKDGLKNTWPYHAVAAVMRGVSLLRSMPEVDRNRIGITGISWGGYLTSIVMSLDNRLKVAVPVYGCGFLHENSAWLPRFKSLPDNEREMWIENFDPSRYLPQCRIPVLWMNGTNDFAYPLDSYQKSYQAMPGPKFLCVTVKMPHSHEAGWARQEIHLFTDAVFRKQALAEAVGRVGKPLVKDDKVLFLFESEVPVHRAQILWTADLDKPWQQREWQSANGSILDLTTAEATVPEARPLVFFLTITDVRGAVSSSEHVEVRE